MWVNRTLFVCFVIVLLIDVTETFSIWKSYAVDFAIDNSNNHC